MLVEGVSSAGVEFAGGGDGGTNSRDPGEGAGSAGGRGRSARDGGAGGGLGGAGDWLPDGGRVLSPELPAPAAWPSRRTVCNLLACALVSPIIAADRFQHGPGFALAKTVPDHKFKFGVAIHPVRQGSTHRVTERTSRMAQGIAIRNDHVPNSAINRKLLEVVGCAAFLLNDCALPLVSQILRDPPSPARWAMVDPPWWPVSGGGGSGAARPGEVAAGPGSGGGAEGWVCSAGGPDRD